MLKRVLQADLLDCKYDMIYNSNRYRAVIHRAGILSRAFNRTELEQKLSYVHAEIVWNFFPFKLEVTVETCHCRKPK